MAIVGAIMVPHPPLIVPEVGRGEEAIIEETTRAYEEAANTVRDLAPETIVLSTPHSVMYSDYFHISPGKSARGDLRQFRAGHVMIEALYDTELVKEICRIADEKHFPAGVMGEKDARLDHGTMVPLTFINKVYPRYRLVRIGLSGLTLPDHYRIGQMIAQAAKNTSRRVVYVASGDLSHKLQEDGPYGFDPAGPVYDEKIMDVCGRAAFDELFDFSEELCDKASECGHRSFVMMAGALDVCAVQTKKLSHQDVTGVGYGICTYVVTGPDPSRNFLTKWESRRREELDERKAREDAYVKLARHSIETYIRTGSRATLPENVAKEMLTEQAGVFVSLKKEGRLRGCIGTIGPTQDSVAEEILENAVSAAVYDSRFRPVTEEELDKLEYSVDVLGKAQVIESEKELDVKRYGVIVTKGRKRGLLLPNLDGVDDIFTQVAIAKQKAGIDINDNDVTLERIEVIRHY
ncbi:MAG: AmmeMemoRadiSam system protein A [Lachnospiraceae bacterium]|nr:AmmeMemoRadiSam system protein A [Lachnospiraceae bacterium]